jgi:hypothetical protein
VTDWCVCLCLGSGWYDGLSLKQSAFDVVCADVFYIQLLLMRTPICARESRDFPAFCFFEEGGL